MGLNLVTLLLQQFLTCLTKEIFHFITLLSLSVFVFDISSLIIPQLGNVEVVEEGERNCQRHKMKTQGLFQFYKKNYIN